MEELRGLLGEELFKKAMEKTEGKGLIIDDGKTIPKHRFDCINISLKEYKEKVRALESEQAILKKQVKFCREMIDELSVYKTENDLLKKLYALTLPSMEGNKA